MRDRGRIIDWTILSVAFALRFANLSLKSPHADEGVNGFFVNQIWQNGFFSYNPQNYHGPLLFYLFQISEKIFGFGVRSFRLVTASISFLTVLVILKSRDVLGRYASLCIALALALSPGMIFFGRSAIHEPVFVFFQVLWMIGLLRLRQRTERQGLLWFSLGLLGCVLMKETFTLLGAAFLFSWGWMEVSPLILVMLNGKLEKPLFESGDIDKFYLIKVCFVGAFLWLFLFTGLFHHWKGAGDFFIALIPWLKTGTAGAGHGKPFFYWLNLILRYEWIVLAGIIFSLPGLVSRSWKIRFFSSLALVNGFIYSAISYKTPWCIISIMWPFLVVTGLYIEAVLDKVWPRRVLLSSVGMGVAVVVFYHSLLASYRLNFINYADASEPYVYVQTKNDLKIVQEIMRKKISVSPASQNMQVQVNLGECWPLPWLFSRLPNVEFGNEDGMLNTSADIIFTEINRNGNALRDLYLRRLIELRDSRKPVYVYLKKSTFEGIDLPGFIPVDSSLGMSGSERWQQQF